MNIYNMFFIDSQDDEALVKKKIDDEKLAESKATSNINVIARKSFEVKSTDTIYQSCGSMTIIGNYLYALKSTGSDASRRTQIFEAKYTTPASPASALFSKRTKNGDMAMALQQMEIRCSLPPEAAQQRWATLE